MTKYQKRLLREANERREKRDYFAVKRHDSTRLTLDETRKFAGHKIQRSRNEKLDRLQRNLTSTQSCKARGEFNYFPGGLIGKPDMYIG